MNKDIRERLVRLSGIGTYPQVFVRSGNPGDEAGFVFMGDFHKVFEMNELGRIHRVFKGCARAGGAGSGVSGGSPGASSSSSLANGGNKGGGDGLLGKEATSKARRSATSVP
uniref:Uncharacterized protein n=2 Tax=Lotharella globosa TaxID=91324 RepID=A0A7S3YZU4_9EUKA